MDYVKKTFDELWNEILTDYRNQFEGKVDTSEGSLVFIKSACLASAIWGVHQHQDYIADQVFPDKMEPDNLEYYGSVRSVLKKSTESHAVYLARVIDFLQQPPAGGNKYDYVKWAKEVDDVEKAWSFPLAQGSESVDVVILADQVATGSEIPTQDMLDAVLAYIEDIRPVGARFVRVLAPTSVAQDITMIDCGETLAAVISSDISVYLNGFGPGQTLHVTQLIAIAVANGATNPVVTTPAGDVVPDAYEMIRPGVIDVT